MVQRSAVGLTSLSLALLLGAGNASAQEPPGAPAQPPQPPPPPQPPGQYPYPYPYPYPPYPPYPYPQPYPYYPYAHPPAPPPRPQPAKPELPEDHAVTSSPFIDALVTLGAYEDRFGHIFDLGVQGGVFIAGRVRVAGRIVAFVDPPSDSAEDNDRAFGGEWRTVESDSPNILWGGAVGMAVVRRTKFVLSPSVVFSRTDDTDYGSFVGVAVPFEWVSESGLRLGFEIGVGRSFGGSVIERCQNLGAPQSCVPGQERRVDRPDGAGFLMQFQLGWGLVR